jgi:hypothetical protein
MSRGVRSRRFTALASALACTAGALAFLFFAAGPALAGVATVTLDVNSASGTFDITVGDQVTFVPKPGLTINLIAPGGEKETLGFLGKPSFTTLPFGSSGSFIFTWNAVLGPTHSAYMNVADIPTPTPTPPVSSTPSSPGSSGGSSSPGSSGTPTKSASGSHTDTGKPIPGTSSSAITVITFGPTGQPVIITGFAGPPVGQGSRTPLANGSFPPVGDITSSPAQASSATGSTSDQPIIGALAAKKVKLPTSLAIVSILALASVSCLYAYRLFGHRAH